MSCGGIIALLLFIIALSLAPTLTLCVFVGIPAIVVIWAIIKALRQ